ncbi:MAG: uridine kinase [Oscillospiraceae bacterium]
MAYSLTTINQALRSDPRGFIAACDAAYHENIVSAARKIAENRKNSAIVLLSGPSGSGKTTTSMKICDELEKLGIRSHAVAMDNYFQTVDPETSPRGPDGQLDFESPFCLDVDLLNRHMAMLERGETIYIPKYEFSRQMRSDIHSRPLRLKKDEIAVFEGIHALNDVFTGRNLNAVRLYISARSNVEDDAGETVFKGTWTRLSRRLMRDREQRGHDASFTLKLWPGVRRGEKLYISPFKENATILFDSSFAYEISVYATGVPALLQNVPEGYERRAEVLQMRRNFSLFEPLDPALVPADSLIREFLGGGVYQY